MKIHLFRLQNKLKLQILGGICMIIMGYFFCGTHFGSTLFFFLMTTTFCIGNLVQFMASLRTANTGEMLAKSYYVNIRFIIAA